MNIYIQILWVSFILVLHTFYVFSLFKIPKYYHILVFLKRLCLNLIKIWFASEVQITYYYNMF